jgi:transcriptional regulator with XRE-family HTH domain
MRGTKMLYFSEKFKQLRKDKDLTQDQIADIFHVSPKCVSRWETGTNYPDVDILPHIAIYFGVTLDELLGTEAIRSEEKVKEYIRDIRNLLNSGKLYDAIELARKATKEYPLNSGLYYHLLQALSKEPEKHKEEIITVTERVINNNPNNWGIKYQLVERYAGWGMKEEAKKILDTMPAEIWDSQEPYIGLLLEGEEWLKNQKSRIVRARYYLEWLIDVYISKADLDTLQKIEYRKAKMQIESLIDEIVGYSVNHLELAFTNIGFAQSYCEAGDIEHALEHLEKGTQDSLHHIEVMDQTNADGSNYMAWSTPRNLPWILWEDELSKAQFDIIRNEEKFIKCVELLKANSRELK